jgi:hypothetical protein
MSKKRIAFINEATRRVNIANRHIRRIAELSNRSRYQFTDAELDAIFATLYAEVAHAQSTFEHLESRGSKDFRLPRIDTIRRQRSERSQSSWVDTFESLAKLRDRANERLRRRRSKPFATDTNADYLLKHVAKSLHLPAKPNDFDRSSWVLRNPANVVVLDAKRAAQTFNTTLEKAPQSMINGRLKKIESFSPEVGAIQAIRAPRGLPLPRGVDRRYAVVLFRRAK